MRIKYKIIQHFKENRVLKVRNQTDNRYFVIKKPRCESSEFGSITLVNELVCFLLGDELGVPVAEIQLVTFQGDVWLRRPWFEKNVSEWYETIGSDRFIPNPRYNCTHFWTVKESYVSRLQKSRLKEILAFDQWVWALDRVPHNVMTDQDEKVKVVDYEHSLNLGTGISFPRNYRKSAQIPNSIERCHPTQMTHGIRFQSQIQELTNSIQSLNRSKIEETVLSATEEVLDCQEKIGRVVDQESVRENSMIIVKLLLMRLRNLRKMMDDLFDGWREVLENNECQL